MKIRNGVTVNHTINRDLVQEYKEIKSEIIKKFAKNPNVKGYCDVDELFADFDK